jgi:hypothetical protein
MKNRLSNAEHARDMLLTSLSWDRRESEIREMLGMAPWLTIKQHTSTTWYLVDDGDLDFSGNVQVLHAHEGVDILRLEFFGGFLLLFLALLLFLLFILTFLILLHRKRKLDTVPDRWYAQ